jgi:CDP-paratose synthetase
VFAVLRPESDTSFVKENKIPYFIFENNIEEFVKFIKVNKIKGVIHLATLFIKDHKSEDIGALISSNVLFGCYVIEASVKAGATWFINTGTSWQHYNSEDYCPANLYAATKQSFEDIARYYYETSNIIFLTIKLSETFGQNDTRPKILNLLSRIAKTNQTLKMSPGEQIIEITHIDNVVDFYIEVINTLDSENALSLNKKNLSPKATKRLTLKMLVHYFENELGQKLNIEWGGQPYRDREIMIPWDNPESLPGWEEKISIQEGIKRFIKCQQ